MFKTELFFKPVLSSELKRFLSGVHYKLFLNHFGMTEQAAKEYVRTHKLKKHEPEMMKQVAELCQSYKFPKTEVLKYPSLFRLNPNTLDQCYHVMNEGGFRRVNAYLLSKFRTYRKRRIVFLKELRLINNETKVSESFINYLDPKPDGFNVDSDDKDIWEDVHRNVLITYLQWRLNAKYEDILKLIETYPLIVNKSFAYICQNIALAEELGFSHEKIINYGYILCAYPKNAKDILEKFPLIAGTPMKKAIRYYPKLMNAKASSIAKIYDILQKHNISDTAISRRLNVFHLNSKTIENRIQNVKHEADLKVLMHNPNSLKLVVHHNRAKARLDFLKKIQLRCASVQLLGEDDVKFDGHIKEGKDTNRSIDLYSFIKGTLQGSENFEATLKKHPYYLHVPLSVMEDTYNFLLNEGFRNSAIGHVIYILLYPREKIKKAMVQLEKLYDKKLTQETQLNVVLYLIEKEHHFTGDGVWEKIASTETSDDNISSSGSNNV